MLTEKETEINNSNQLLLNSRSKTNNIRKITNYKTTR